MANYNYKHVIKLKASTVLRFLLKRIILSQYMCLISLVVMYQYPHTIIIQVSNHCSVLLYNIVVLCKLYLIIYMYFLTIYLIFYLSDYYYLVMFSSIAISENHLNNIKTIMVYNIITLYDLNWNSTELMILPVYARGKLIDCCVHDSCFMLKLFNYTIYCACTSGCCSVCLCILSETLGHTLDYLTCSFILYSFISMYVLHLFIAGLLFLLFGLLNIRIYYTLLVCTCNSTPALIATKSILTYCLTKFINLFNCITYVAFHYHVNLCCKRSNCFVTNYIFLVMKISNKYVSKMHIMGYMYKYLQITFHTCIPFTHKQWQPILFSSIKSVSLLCKICISNTAFNSEHFIHSLVDLLRPLILSYLLGLPSNTMSIIIIYITYYRANFKGGGITEYLTDLTTG